MEKYSDRTTALMAVCAVSSFVDIKSNRYISPGTALLFIVTGLSGMYDEEKAKKRRLVLPEPYFCKKEKPVGPCSCYTCELKRNIFIDELIEAKESKEVSKKK